MSEDLPLYSGLALFVIVCMVISFNCGKLLGVSEGFLEHSCQLKHGVVVDNKCLQEIN